LPLYRQSEIYARQDVELERSTLADWVGSTSRLLTPLVDALRRYVMSRSHPADARPDSFVHLATDERPCGKSLDYSKNVFHFLLQGERLHNRHIVTGQRHFSMSHGLDQP
jgi:hypothetical protein